MKVYVDRAGVAVNVRGWLFAWWRPGVWVPLSVRSTPDGRFGRFVARRRPRSRS